ncbi:ABC transporter permease [Persicimonas caeni]|uniref:ABC transporter permease n=2 Tax=Persicimonas caeni TaxID=2292766 RepID=A0A4Y6Q4R4_PERCE|nr:ABC transporter permease [Persicimonas caeni]QED36197.1 ABC transporter permease [Persicimonas caeni]
MSGFSLPYVDYVGLSEMDGVSAIFPPVEYSYRDIDLQAVQQDPSWTHWLGTDRKGRDVFTRLLYGTRISLTIGVVAVGIYVTIGAILGSLAGYFGGKIDSVILRMIEVMLCFPTFFLILTIRGFIDDPSIFHIMVIIGLTGWTKVARLVRGEFLRLKNQEFVQAAKAMGLKQGRIIFRHILPNSLGPVLVAATFGVAGAILIEASLSFLGLGPPTAPSWGQILTTGRETGQMALILAPGFAIFVTVSLLNLVGEGVRDAIDPKLRK